MLFFSFIPSWELLVNWFKLEWIPVLSLQTQKKIEKLKTQDSGLLQARAKQEARWEQYLLGTSEKRADCVPEACRNKVKAWLAPSHEKLFNIRRNVLFLRFNYLKPKFYTFYIDSLIFSIVWFVSSYVHCRDDARKVAGCLFL